ncbi:hypothetical protein N9W34_07045, partial [Rickettsiales bacterium]|nr:hypothetical protein [Rickettsiales bacterium]
ENCSNSEKSVPNNSSNSKKYNPDDYRALTQMGALPLTALGASPFFFAVSSGSSDVPGREVLAQVRKDPRTLYSPVKPLSASLGLASLRAPAAIAVSKKTKEAGLGETEKLAVESLAINFAETPAVVASWFQEKKVGDAMAKNMGYELAKASRAVVQKDAASVLRYGAVASAKNLPSSIAYAGMMSGMQKAGEEDDKEKSTADRYKEAAVAGAIAGAVGGPLNKAASQAAKGYSLKEIATDIARNFVDPRVAARTATVSAAKAGAVGVIYVGLLAANDAMEATVNYLNEQEEKKSEKPNNAAEPARAEPLGQRTEAILRERVLAAEPKEGDKEEGKKGEDKGKGR